MVSHSAAGYINDVPYAFHFARELAPAWLDFVVTLSGFEAPQRTGSFAWCELGCGQGVTAAVIAATHPTGEFHGIDAFAPHIQRAQQLCDNAGITNLALHATDFASAIDLDLPSFDYIVAHGLCAANQIRPVGPESTDVERLNKALADHLDETETRFVALPYGTAVAVPPA